MQAEDKELLKKFLYGHCTPEENQRVQELLLLPDAEEVMQELTFQEWNEPEMPVAESASATGISTVMNRWKEKLNTRIAAGAQETEETEWVSKPGINVFSLRYAAVWAGLLIVGFLAIQQFRKTNRPDIITYVQKINRQNKPVKYLLPDSSEVYLGPGSRLRFPAQFAGRTRELSLQGEAFFQVKHNALKPFMIHTGEILTQVLGTSFKVQAFEGQRLVVAVATGKVGVSRHTAKLSETLALLTPGHTVTWNSKTGEAVEGTTDISGLQQWTSGDMVFEEQTMAEIALELQRRYAVQLDFADKSIADHQVSGTFPANKPIEKIMKALAAAGKFQYETSNHKSFKIYKSK